MKSLNLAILTLLVSTSIQAGCLQNAKEEIKKANQVSENHITLVKEESRILKPNEDTLAYGGEIYNATKRNMEVFFVSQSDGYGGGYYSAMLMDKETCRLENVIKLGDNNR